MELFFPGFSKAKRAEYHLKIYSAGYCEHCDLYDYDGQFEAGLRFGCQHTEHNYEVAFFGRNITDEKNIIGGIDFNNNTAYVNQPRIFG